MEKNERNAPGIGLVAILLGFCCSLHIMAALGGFTVFYGFMNNNLILFIIGLAILFLLLFFYIKRKGKTCCNTERLETATKMN